MGIQYKYYQKHSRVTDILVICNETNNPPDVIDSGSIVVDILIPLGNGISPEKQKRIDNVLLLYEGVFNDPATRSSIVMRIKDILKSEGMPFIIQNRKPMVDNRSQEEKDVADIILG
jgi:hypothetical protein